MRSKQNKMRKMWGSGRLRKKTYEGKKVWLRRGRGDILAHLNGQAMRTDPPSEGSGNRKWGYSCVKNPNQ